MAQVVNAWGKTSPQVAGCQPSRYLVRCSLQEAALAASHPLAQYRGGWFLLARPLTWLPSLVAWCWRLALKTGSVVKQDCLKTWRGDNHIQLPIASDILKGERHRISGIDE